MRVVLLVVIIGVIAAALLVSFLLGNKIAQGIASSLSGLGGRLQTFAKGVLSEPFPETDSQDEVADMVQTAKDMAQNLAMVIQDAKYRLGEMANGDYTVESKIPDRYVGEFSELHTAIHQMNLNMNDTLHRIEEASEQVSARAGNLADESAQSAVNTRNLIMDAIKEIEDGTQADAMKQAEDGVNQISEVVQSNSATAEESSATSEELSAQAVSLDELVKRFKLK